MEPPAKDVSVHKDDETDRVVAVSYPASAESIKLVLRAAERDEDGRSPFMWVRLYNGDLILGVFPHGATYEYAEDDAQTPWPENSAWPEHR